MEHHSRERKKSDQRKSVDKENSPLQNPIFLKMQQDPYFRSGYLYQMAGNFNAAAACYSRSIQTSPSAEAHTFLGWVLSLMGELDGAIFQVRRALELNPEFGNAWNDLGAYLIEKFAYDEAIDCLNKALNSKGYTQKAFAHYNLGRVYICKGMFVGAQKALKQAIKLDPGFMQAKILLEQLNRQVQ